MYGILVSRVISRAQMSDVAAAATGFAFMLFAGCLPAAMAAVPADPNRRLYC